MRPYQKPANDSAYLAFYQFITPPYRPETGVSQSGLPVYAALNPIVPLGLPYRAIGAFPNFSNRKQWQHVLTQANLLFWRR